MEKLISLENISKSYGDTNALSDVSLHINRGEIFGLLGPNGAGKTTLIKLLVKILKPDSGSIVVRHSKDDIFQQEIFGICPQEIVLWGKLTCSEQLNFMGKMYGVDQETIRKRIDEILQKIGLEDKAHAPASALSGGMKRRLNLGLALVHDPPILILDEPEAGLDPQSRILVRDYIRELAADKTIIFSTHNMDEADRLADRVAVIDSGRVLAVDTPAGLKASVGDGDVLEVLIPNADAIAESDLNMIGIRKIVIMKNENKIIFRGLNLVQLLPEILQKLTEMGTAPMEIKLRENTLEDVFIELTGRGLRE